jgi:hypothetical protein
MYFLFRPVKNKIYRRLGDVPMDRQNAAKGMDIERKRRW